MANIQKLSSEFKAALALKERELLFQQEEVLLFLDTKHNLKATEEYQAAVHSADLEIDLPPVYVPVGSRVFG